MGWKYPEDRRAYHRAYMRDRRAWIKEHHMCTECKEVDALTMAGGKRVLVAIPLWVDYCLFDSCGEVQTTTINAKPAEPDVFDFTICQFDNTVQILKQLAQGIREYYFVIRDKASKRLIVEKRIIGRLTVKGFGSEPETLRISITAEGPVDSHWKAV